MSVRPDEENLRVAVGDRCRPHGPVFAWSVVGSGGDALADAHRRPAHGLIRILGSAPGRPVGERYPRGEAFVRRRRTPQVG